MKTLSITIEDALLEKLKMHISSGRISKFISSAIEEKIEERERALYAEYISASQDLELQQELKEWDHISYDNW